VERILGVIVYGEARPQGSKRYGVGSKSGKPYGYETVKGSRPWRKDVKQVLARQWAGQPRLGGPIAVRIDFYMDRPKCRKGEVWHPTSPDWDKLARNIMDALQETVIKNDGQGCHAIVRKFYSNHPKVVIEVGRPDEKDAEGMLEDAEEEA